MAQKTFPGYKQMHPFARNSVQAHLQRPEWDPGVLLDRGLGPFKSWH